MSLIILAIDDEPIRYRDFPTVVLTTCRMEDYLHYVHQHMWTYRSDFRIKGILLDHDMPFQNGQWFARHIAENLQVPVALVSSNSAGRDAMYAILSEYEVPVIHCPVTERGWQTRALDFFTGEPIPFG